MQILHRFAREWIIPHVRVIAAIGVVFMVGVAALALATGENEAHAVRNPVPASVPSARPAVQANPTRSYGTAGPSRVADVSSDGIRQVNASIAGGPASSGAAVAGRTPADACEVRLADATDDDRGLTIQADFEQADGAATHGQIHQIASQSGAGITPIRQRDESPVPQAASNPFAEVPTLPSENAVVTATGPVQRLVKTQAEPPATVEARWERVGEITIGRPCRCDLIVKNSGAGTADSVAVEAAFPHLVRLTSAEPMPTSVGDRLVWTVGTLAPGAEKRIAVAFVPSRGGDLPLSAVVRSTDTAATTLHVLEPQLHLAIEGVTEIPIGEATAQTIVVSNPGTGTTDDVMVEIALPSGLEHGKGRTITMPLGSLGAKQSHSIPLTLIAAQGGPQAIRVRAVAGPMLRQETSTTVVVSAPTLKVAADGPGVRFVGRHADYVVSIVNEGAAAASGVRVSHKVPEGFTFVSAAQGGRYEPDSREIVWYVGRIEPRQSVSLVASLTATAAGAHKHVVAVTGEGGTRVETVVDTAVESTSSLVVEVVDLDDPVELGVETGYEVRIRNEGTRPATKVAVVCQVPAGVASLAARGPTNHHGEGNLLTFEPIEELKPGTTALFRVAVRGLAAGKHRFRVRLTSDSIDEPLVHEELTHYYAD